MAITHAKVSTLPDGSDPNMVQATDWNADHTGTLDVANGGTGAATFTNGGVLIGNITGAIQATTAGLLGEVLTGNGLGIDPTFQATAASSLIVGSTAIASGTSGRVLYDNAGVLGEMTTTGSGTVLVLATSPTLVTPILGVAAATSIAVPALTTASGAMTITPAAGSNLNIALSTTGDFAVNTNQLYVDTSTGDTGFGTATPNGKIAVESSTVNKIMVTFYNSNTTAAASVPFFLASKSGGSDTNVSFENVGAGAYAVRTGATSQTGYGSARFAISSGGIIGLAGVITDASIMTGAKVTIDPSGVLLNLLGAGNTQQFSIGGASFAGTGYVYGTISNTGAAGLLGIENSTGGALLSGGLAYATVFGTTNSTALQLGTNSVAWLTIDTAGNVGRGVTSITAGLHLKAGTATASTAPLKFNSGTLLTTPEAGAAEFLTDAYYVTTTTGAKRRMIVAGITGRATAQTAAAASVATYTLGAADATYEVAANVLVTTATVHNFTVTCTYTDEGNTARTLTLPFSVLAGTFATSITNAGGAVPYEGVPLQIRCKASTAITIQSDAGGTYTTVTYNIEGVIKQTA